MCGVLALFITNKIAPQVEQFAKALTTINHRGPDSSNIENLPLTYGSLLLGHNRLSIIDLSSGGNQPMSSDDKNLSIIFNGEIYNFKELRSELEIAGCRFRSLSDTEVLLKAWEKWGPSCVNRLVGMFAFCITNISENEMWCVRDNFGMKPLFFHWEKNRFIVASEITPIRKIISGSVKFNSNRLRDYLVWGDYDGSSESFFKDVQSLRPGHLINIKLNENIKVIEQKWSTPPPLPDINLNFSNAASQLKEIIFESVDIHLRSDVPVAFLLSGGVDSTALACVARQLYPKLEINAFCFSASEPEFDEADWATNVAMNIGASMTKVELNENNLLGDLDKLIEVQAEPFGSTSLLAQFAVYRKISECGFKVAISGQGGDEMFGGYLGYPGYKIRSFVEGGDFSRALYFCCYWLRSNGGNVGGLLKAIGFATLPKNFIRFLLIIFGYGAKSRFFGSTIHEEDFYESLFNRRNMQKSFSGKRISEVLQKEASETSLPRLLRHEDRTSMHFSVEGRLPFLNPSIHNFHGALPDNFFVSDQSVSKNLFKAAMQGVVPDAVLNRKDKKGFTTPESRFIRNYLTYKQSDVDILEEHDFLDVSSLKQEVDDVIRHKKPADWFHWRIANLITLTRLGV